MTTTKKFFTGILIPTLLGISFISSAVLAAKPMLDNKVAEYYLKGTLEQTSSFNFNIDPGDSVSDYLTVVNNTDQPFHYNLSGLDSKINNQQMIVFKANKEESPNLGQWITFPNNIVTVEPQSSLEIPFSINVPVDAFPGSYHGGLAIEKITADSIQSPGQSFVVKVQTRQVLGLNANIAGATKSTFVLSDLHYDPLKKTYNFAIENTGNTILSFEGLLTISGNNLFETIEKEIKVERFRILPQNSVNQKVLYLTPPLFGNHQVTLNGEIKYFNGMKNADESLETVQLNYSHSFMAWDILYWTIGGLLLLLLLTIVLILRDRNYLKRCTQYSVQPDDTLITIAQQHQMSWKKLAKINKISAPYSIKPGQKILVHDKNKQ